METRVNRLTHFISFRLYPNMRFRNGPSHAKNLRIFIPPRSSCNSFARLSVHCMLDWRILNIDFMLTACIGIAMRNIAKPARALAPRMSIRRARQIASWIGAVQDIWKKPALKSILETSVEMWLTSLPFVSVDRALAVRRNEREYIAVIKPPRRRTPADVLR